MDDQVILPGMPLTAKGQVTVPKELRDHLGLRPGSKVAFVLEADGRVVLRRDDAAGPADSRVAEARRAVRGRNSLTTDQIMRLTRDEGWGDAG